MKKICTSVVSIAIIFFSLIAFVGCSSAPVKSQESELSYTYSKLKLLDLDQMSDLIQDRLNRYKKTGNEDLLEDALRICLARPDEDGMVEKLIENIRFSLDSNEQWEELVENTVQKSTDKLKDETTAVEDQVSYLILLENLVAQFRPEFLKQDESPQFESRIIERIAEADIVVSDAAANEQKLNLMNAVFSPSDVAREMLRKRDERLKEKNK